MPRQTLFAATILIGGLAPTAASPMEIRDFKPKNDHECQFHETMATAHSNLGNAWDEYFHNVRLTMLGCFKPTEEASNAPAPTIR